jgi:hypothetical protein
MWWVREFLMRHAALGRSSAGALLALVLLPACGTETKRVPVEVPVEVPVPTPVYDPPLAFQLASPTNGEPLALPSPTFRWTVSNGAFSYRLQVSATSDFSALVIDQAGILSITYKPAAPLAGQTTHWWRVYGVNGTAATLADGSPRSFTTVSTANAWSTVGSDARHSGHNPSETGVPPLAFAWNAANGSTALNPVAYENGLVFVTNTDYFVSTTALKALNASTGATEWSYAFGSVFRVGQPSVSNGRVFVGQCEHTPGTFLWSFNASTGAVRWASPVSAQWERYWAPIVVGGSVYMNGGYYGGLYGFDADTGAELFFNNQLEQYDEWSPAYGGGTLYTFISGRLRSHDPAGGAIQGTVTVPWNWAGWSMKTCPVVGDGRVYVIAPPVLYSIDPVAGLVDWQTTGFAYAGMPALADGSVYAISGGILHARDASTGVLRWSFPGDTALNQAPVVAAGHVFASSASNVYAVRASDGVQVWTQPVGGWLTLAAGKLFVARGNGVLTAYSLSP